MRDDWSAQVAVGRSRLPREQRRAQLLRAAGAVFSAKGYHATVMDDVAEAAGVSKPVLYQHFASKLELYLALLETTSQNVLSMMREATQATENNAERVFSAISRFFTYVHEDPASRLVFESDLTADPQVSTIIWQLHTDLASLVGEVIATDTDLAPDEARLLGVSLVGMAQMAARYWVEEDAEIASERAIELIGTLAWRGVARFPLDQDRQQP